MKRFKENWEITQNWQLIHPILGVLLSLGAGFLIAKNILKRYVEDLDQYYYLIIIFLSLLFAYAIIKLSLYFFKKLENRWIVDARWQYIAIFIVFAITGSLAGKLSNPLMEFIGLSKESVSGWIFWPIRILILLPIYQVLLFCIGWLFGQHMFFYPFIKKMATRLGCSFLFPKD